MSEMAGCALTNSRGKLTASKAASDHEPKNQRRVVHQVGGPRSNSNEFMVSLAVESEYVASSGRYTTSANNAAKIAIALGTGLGHTAQEFGNGQYNPSVPNNNVAFTSSRPRLGFNQSIHYSNISYAYTEHTKLSPSSQIFTITKQRNKKWKMNQPIAAGFKRCHHAASHPRSSPFESSEPSAGH